MTSKKRFFNNYKKARSVKELADLCGNSLSSFKRKFLKEFREPAGSWLQKQINGMIKHKLEDEKYTYRNHSYGAEFFFTASIL